VIAIETSEDWQPVLMANDRIGCSLLVSEFRFRTKIALAIATPELNLLMNQ
jgi:hypothetical protein